MHPTLRIETLYPKPLIIVYNSILTLGIILMASGLLHTIDNGWYILVEFSGQ